jgi:hypothetical protein
VTRHITISLASMSLLIGMALTNPLPAQDPHLAQFNLTNAEFTQFLNDSLLSRFANRKSKPVVLGKLAVINFDEIDLDKHWTLQDAAERNGYPLQELGDFPGFRIISEYPSTESGISRDSICSILVASMPYQTEPDGPIEIMYQCTPWRGCQTLAEKWLRIPEALTKD